MTSASNPNPASALTAALEALASELPPGRRRREMRELAQSLREKNDPEILATTSTSTTTTTSNQSRMTTDAWLPVFSKSLATPSTAMRLSDWMNQASRENAIRGRLRRVLLYPAAVFGLAVLVFFGLGQMVVSPFRKMYDEFGLNLPAPTEFLFFWVAQWQDHTFRFVVYVALIGIVACLIISLWLRHALSTRLFGFFSGGNTANVAAMASFSGLLADLLASDVPLAESLELAGQGCGHAHFKHAAQRLAQFRRRGLYRLAQSPDARAFPRNLIEAIDPMDGSAPRTSLLHELAAIYGERAIERTQWSTGTVGAIAVFAVGMVVAFIVISLFMPLVSLISGLS